ncbi:Alpha-D-glucose-1-phosphate phosphatase YihX [Nereida ignava]|uniref:Alpha-D-glucose-1-phosphate phosphatase YihX n=1 Tax=Nereida ignava TaxID=282199 RepID=A0A0U1NNL8_9RHOB|nr:HAD family phosphatase [Nereida ignava]CRK76099.1 Alpha-D-glucose-1-phosphate phosphatase YihX [Nereida ignava]SFJ85039.1 2-haloacid dehalogenase [Nereida ignava DSM 16309]
MTPDIVVFDIGGVLIDWQPHLAWVDEMDAVEAQAFMDRIAFDKLNLACDAGATFALAASQIADPADAARLGRYVERYQHTVPAKITGTWDILYALKDARTSVHAISNWSAETWPEGCKAHPELLEVFDTIVVSGEVGVIKPSTEIYALLCHRTDIAPQRCVFIDDGLHNCIGARAAGMDAIHFTGPDALRTELEARSLL